MKIYKYLLAMLLMAALGQAQAAIYIKYDGIDGEAKDANHDKWIDIVSLVPSSIKPGQILIGLTKDGRKIPLRQDGRIQTADGKMIIIVNGKVSRVQTGKKAALQPGRKVLTPSATKGFNPQPEPPAARSRKLQPGDDVSLRPQPEPPGKPRHIQAR